MVHEIERIFIPRDLAAVRGTAVLGTAVKYVRNDSIIH
jgi:hypothetical protein